MIRKLLGVALCSPLLVVGSAIAGSSHFGVPDRAAHVPSWIDQAEKEFLNAQASAGATACPDKMTDALRYAKEAMNVYWSCRDQDAKGMLARAIELANQAASCGTVLATAAPRVLELSAATLFAFDKSTLSARGKMTLDNLLSDLQANTYTDVLIVGHTDPLGETTYNQRLSERRAKTVARYLIDHGVPGELVQAEGRGERELKVTYQQCAAQGATTRRALIDCYEPNRRVTVSINGLR